MEIQFFGGNSFSVKGKNASLAFDPNDKVKTDKLDIVTQSAFSGAIAADIPGVKKTLSLPGEYEVSEILVKAVLSPSEKNIIYKATLEGISWAHFGSLKVQPSTELLDGIGDTDIAMINVSGDFDEKEVKKLIENVDPRIAIIGGDDSLFSKVTEQCHAKTAEENPLKVSRSQFSDEITEVWILPV